MNSEKLNKQIDLTDYWDSQLLDFEIKYLDDEASLYIEKYDGSFNEEFCWEIRFLRCAKVIYDTEADWTRVEKDGKQLSRVTDVKNLRGGATARIFMS